MRWNPGRRKHLIGLWFCVVAVLLTSACGAQGGASPSAPAPTERALTIFAAQGSKLVAYRARDGATRWTYAVTGEDTDFDLDAPLRYGDGLVLGYTYNIHQPGHVTLAAMDAANGQLRWRMRLENIAPPYLAIGADYLALVLGTPQSPGPLRIIRASDGSVAHNIPLSGSGWVAADVVTDGDTAYVCPDNAVLTAYSLADGQQLWSVPVAPGAAMPHAACTVRVGGGVIFSQVSISTGGGISTRALVALRASDGRQLWQMLLGLDAFTLTDGIGYTYTFPQSSNPSAGSLTAYRAADGARLWQIPGGSQDIASDGKVLAFSQAGDVRAVRPSDGVSLWRYPHPAGRELGVEGAVDSVVFARASGTGTAQNPAQPGVDTRPYLLVLGADNGRVYWQMPLDLSNLAFGDAT